MTTPILWYFADPMCSWCWGFSPVIREIKQEFAGSLKIALVLGGLSPGNDKPLTQVQREEILHHWHEVEKLTGQQFGFDAALPDGFVYDTEPASRAIIAFGELNADDRMDYLQAIQQAFYVDNRDVTQEQLLAELAAEFGVEQDPFLALFGSDKMHERTLLHFQQARKAGVRGFPTLVLQKEQGIEKICGGYTDFKRLRETLSTTLAT